MSIPRRDYRLNITANVRALIARANKGSAEALWELQRHVDSDPALAAYIGDLAGLAEQTIIVLACGENSLALDDGVHRQLLELERSLIAEGDSALEQLLIRRVCVAWLWSYACDIRFAHAQQAAAKLGAAGVALVREAERQAALRRRTVSGRPEDASPGSSALPSAAIAVANLSGGHRQAGASDFSSTGRR